MVVDKGAISTTPKDRPPEALLGSTQTDAGDPPPFMKTITATLRSEDNLERVRAFRPGPQSAISPIDGHPDLTPKISLPLKEGR